jgi:heme exporter protein D
MLRGLGLFGWVGLALMAAALAYAAVYVPQRQNMLDDARDEIARLQRQRTAQVKSATPRPAAPAVAGPSAFSASSAIASALPTTRNAPQALLYLDGMARKHKLQLARNAYSYVERVPDKVTAAAAAGGKAAASDRHAETPSQPSPQSPPLVEVRVAVPVSGKYGDIRAFIAQALAAGPTLALDGMTLSREMIGQAGVQAQLRFTLFVRSNG